MTIFINKGDKVQYLKGLDVPKVGGLFIDKLTMTMEIEPVLQKVVKKRFVELVNLGQAYNVATTIYDINIKPTGGDADTAGILIQCAPKSAGYKNSPKNFFRLECNPSHADLGYLKGLIDYLLEESGGYKKLMKTGSVTRLDISVDVDYLGPTDILASYGKIKTVLHFTKNGKIETKYLGATGSNKQIMLYDKTAEIVKSNKKKSAWGKDSVPDHKIMRIEIKLSKTKSTLSGRCKVVCVNDFGFGCQ
jgi:hypothetical protein